MTDELSAKDQKLLDILERANVEMPAPTPPVPKTNSQTWHIKAESEKGCFQWLVDEDGSIVDCPYHLRGYWIGRLVDMDKLLNKEGPKLIVRCNITNHLDEVYTTSLQVDASNLDRLPEYVYDAPYTGGLYDFTSL